MRRSEEGVAAKEAGVNNSQWVSLESLPTKKSAAEKVQLAALMKTTTSVSNGWLAKRLEMGKPGSVTQYVRRFRKRGGVTNHASQSALSKVHT